MTDLDQALEALLAACVQAYETSGDAGIDGILRAHPEHADRVRTNLAELRRLGLLEENPADGGSLPAVFGGDFERLERIGGGGMGIVYRARQRSLDRNVALKIIRPDQAWLDVARERFHREVTLAAQLQHPGIVPIYAVGEQDRIPWFAMELVSGCTLAEAIARGTGASGDVRRLRGEHLRDAVAGMAGVAPDPASELWRGSWPDAAVRIAERVAGALAHAHAHGVFHRDVKPSNVLLTPDGRVQLFDFGLARGAADTRVTRTGVEVGSPAYMAPEQARGAAVDARADVYGLGVTLFESLTGALPSGKETGTDLWTWVARGRRPSPRERNPAVPRDVAVVCLVALDPDPLRRYQDMHSMRADLQRVLRREPPLARPPGAWLRLRRWAQRHPSVTVASGLTVLLLLLTPTLLWLQQRAAAQRIARRESQARENLTVALYAIDKFMEEVAANDLLVTPGLAGATRRMLEEALGLFERLEPIDLRQSQAIGGRRARGERLLANALFLLGDVPGAEEHLQLACRAADSLRPGALRENELAATETLRAMIAGVTGRRDEARDHLAAALTHLEKPFGDDLRLLNVELVRADVELQDYDLAEARRALDDASQMLQRLDHSLTISERVRWHQLRARVANLEGADTVAIEHGKTLEGLCDEMARKHPYTLRARDVIAEARQSRALQLLDGGDVPRAVALLEQAVAEREKICEDFPGHARMKVTLAEVRGMLADALTRTGDIARAERELATAGEVATSGWIEQMPNGPELKLSHLRRAARVHGMQRRRKEALAALEQAAELGERAAQDPGATARFKLQLAKVWNNLGVERRRQRKLEAAREALEKALTLKRSLLGTTRTVALLSSCAFTENNLGNLFRQLGDLDAAIQRVETAVAMKREVFRRRGYGTDARSLASSLHNLAGLRLESRARETAVATLEEALRLHEKASATDDTPRSRRLHANTCLALAGQLLREAPQRAAELAGRAATLCPTDARRLFDAARTVARAARAAIAREHLARAVAWLRAAREHGLAKSRLEDSALAPLRALPEFRALLR